MDFGFYGYLFVAGGAGWSMVLLLPRYMTIVVERNAISIQNAESTVSLTKICDLL
jgi:hypothetical protein